MAAIRLENIHKSFREGQDSVLRGASIEFLKGQLTFILGSSGAGKSVLIKHILGLLSPDQGKVWVDGVEIGSLKPADLTEFRLRFGMLFQNAALFDDFTVYDNVAFPLREHSNLNEDEISARIKKTLTLLGMERGWDKYPNELSGGMRKRVGLARAIIREPSILLYDEPTTGLDPVTRNTVERLIEQLKKELRLTSLVISHDIPSALLLADRIAFLHAGQFVFDGTPDEFRRSSIPEIREFIDAERRAIRAFEV